MLNFQHNQWLDLGTEWKTTSESHLDNFLVKTAIFGCLGILPRINELISCKTCALIIIYKPILRGYDFRKSMFLRRECTRIAGSLTVRSSRGNPAEEERSDNKETNLLSSPL